MSRRRSTMVGAGLALVLVVVAVVVGVRWFSGRDHTEFERAVALAPDDAQRMSWTDWSAVRAQLHVDLDTGSSPGQVEAFLNRGFNRDLTSGSAMVTSSSVLQRYYGFSPASIDWELFSQADDGAVITMGLPDDTDFDQIAGDLTSLGYTRPSSSTGVWNGGEALLAAVGEHGSITPEFQYVALDPGRHLVLASDTATYLKAAIGDVAADKDPSPGVQEVVDDSGSPVSAAVYTSDYVCSALAMAHADAGDQQEGETLLAAAGKVNPLQGFAMSAQPDRDVRVSMSFDDHDEAVTNADTRSKLAAGPAPGQGGAFTDRFTLGPVTAHDDLVTMTLKPKSGAYVLSDLDTGPLLFATC